MPPSDALTRRLLAVAVVDVAGYSALMERDESGTHRRVNEVFGDVVAPVVRATGGRIVDRAGDGLLLEFGSSTDAVKCALAIQRAMAERSEAAEAGGRIELRIGINVGDLIVDGDRIVGDGVNVAARLEAAALPGGICISASVREQLREDIGAAVTEIGEIRVKNIARPVRAFRVSAGPPTLPSRLGGWWAQAMRTRALRWALYAAIAGALVIAGRFGVPLMLERSASSAPAMSVVVVPFGAADPSANASSADAVTQEVTRGLAATPWLEVTAPNVARRVAGDVHDVGAIGRELNVRYLVFGQLQRRDGRLGVDAQLIDAAKGVSAWNAYVAAGEGAAPESRLALQVVIRLREAVYAAESKRLVASGAAPSTPMEFKIFGDMATDTHFVTLATERAGRKYYEDALKLDPNFVPALISVGYTLLSELDLDPDVDREAVLERIDAIAKRAVTTDQASAPAWQFRAEALARQWRWDAALDASDTALDLDPGRAFALGQRASLMVLLGRPAEALALVDRALALAEQRFGFAFLQRCRAQMALGDYAAAIASCQKSISREDWWMPHAYLAAAYALVEDDASMKRERAVLQRLSPGFSVGRIEAIRYSNVPACLRQTEDHLYRGLRAAGMGGG